MSINQRIIDLENFANEKGISSFAKYIGIPPTTYSNIAGGRFSEPKHGVLAKILKAFPELNPMWLMLGEGEMWLEEKKPSTRDADLDELKEKMDMVVKILEDKNLL